MSEDYLTPEERAARHREQVVLQAVRRMQKARPDLGDPMLLLIPALREWAEIPTEAVPAAVEQAIKIHGIPHVSIVAVRKAWQSRHKPARIRPEEIQRRKELAQARIEREVASPAESDRFFREISAQLAAI